jgi:hypothetical protein
MSKSTTPGTPLNAPRLRLADEPLTPELGAQLRQAVHTLRNMNEINILTPDREKQIIEAQSFLQQLMPRYADELVACWFAVRTEYEPLITVLTPVISRVNSTIKMNRARQQQQAEGKDQSEIDAKHPQTEQP